MYNWPLFGQLRNKYEVNNYQHPIIREEINSGA